MYPRKNHFDGPSKVKERNWIMLILETVNWKPTIINVNIVITAPWIIAERMNLFPQYPWELAIFLVSVDMMMVLIMQYIRIFSWKRETILEWLKIKENTRVLAPLT